MTSYSPRRYGFAVVGDGPCYVLSVEKRSSADRAGLRHGDQIVEIAGQDVSDASAATVTAILRHCKQSAPTIGVASRLRRIDVIPVPPNDYGFLLRGAYGGDAAVATNVERNGQAYGAGLREGDIVLELNGQLVRSPDGAQSTLDATHGKIKLGLLPMSSRGQSTAAMSDLNSSEDEKAGQYRQQQEQTARCSRVQSARELHAKMNFILGDQFEKKMAIIGVLKTYADDRNVDKFASALSLLLQTPEQKEILLHLRAYVPVKDLAFFDSAVGLNSMSASLSRLCNNSSVDQRRSFTRLHSRTASVGSNLATQGQGDQGGGQKSLLYLRCVKVHRANSSLGVVLKGRGPVYVESVVPKSPADLAGILRGDCILKVDGIDVRRLNHHEMVRLLQASSESPLLQVVQNISAGERQQQPLQSGEGSGVTLTDIRINDEQDASTISSRNSDWAVMSDLLQDDEGRQIFKEKANYLLTKAEKSTLKKLLREYQQTKDIGTLTESLTEILDSQAKLALWLFIIPLLPTDHHEYVLDRVPFSEQLLEEYQRSGYRVNDGLRSDLTNNGYFARASRAPSSTLSTHSHAESSSSMLSTAVRLRGLDEGQIAITSFRQRIDFLLTSRERQEVKKALQLYRKNGNIQNFVEDASIILDTPSKRSLWIHLLHFMPDEHQLFTRQKLDIPNGFLRTGTAATVAESEENNEDMPDGDDSVGERNAVLHKSDDEFFICRETRDWMRNRKAGSSGNDPVTSQSSLNPLFEQSSNLPLRRSVSATSSLGHEARETDGMLTSETIDLPQDLNGSYQFGRSNTALGPHSRVQLPLRWPPASSSAAHQNGGGGGDDDLLGISDVSLRNKMRQALQAIDDAMATEEPGDDEQSNRNGSELQAPPPPLAPPPLLGAPLPPPPPPPLPPNGLLNVRRNADAIQVKRINWETLQPDNIQQTVWGRQSDGEWDYIQDMVKYLELEQQFTTLKKPAVSIVAPKKKEAHVLSAKKAYNTSIVLAHLKMSVSELKRALLAVNEDVLTPELTSQLVQFAPDASEVEHYASYTGRVEELSHVDQFAYEMSRIPGYEARLRALLFKSTFDEKCLQVHQQLRVIRMAAQEVRNSKKLTKLLELVLAMGNQLNKGTKNENATAFRIPFLAKLESTKTADKKQSFLHVLANTVHVKVPELLAIDEDLSSLPEASRVLATVPFDHISKEISEINAVLHKISSTIDHLAAEEKHFSDIDRFEDVMLHFVSKASDEIQRMTSLLHSTKAEYDKMATYLGERPNSEESKDIFQHLSSFVLKFVNAHRFNMMQRGQ